MNRTIRILSLSLFCFGAVQAGPIKSFKMDATNGWRSFPVLNGGAFLARMDVGTPAEKLIEVFCVDDTLSIAKGQAFTGFYSTIADASLNPTNDVRYETEVFPLANGTVGSDAAEFRYKMAAYLISQYDRDNSPDVNYNKAIQNSIWEAIRPAGSHTTTYSGVNYFNLAAGFVVNNPNDDLFKNYRIISGWTAQGGVQTFMTHAPVPEPGTYAMLGAGLLAIGMYGRHRRRRQDQ